MLILDRKQKHCNNPQGRGETDHSSPWFQDMKTRTNKQNKSMHLWFEMLSKALNDAGLSVMKTMNHDAEIPWSSVTVKEILFKEMMMAAFQKTSTTQLSTIELTIVSETLMRYLAEKHGLQVDFPSLESLIMNERLKD